MILGYVAAALIFVVVDMIWLGTMVPRFYRPVMDDIALASVNLPAAMAFYIIYPVGLMIFGIYPALKAGSVSTALAYGAAFGFFTYATYDLTSYATLRNWTLSLTVVDVLWGTFLAGLASAAAFLIVTKILGHNV
jgi:uncharacterized membrane protein